jgi:hypothetical protein
MPHHSEAGFSILEALIAATVFAVAVVSLVQLVMHSAAQSLRTEMATVGVTLAQSKLEFLRATPFAFDASGVRTEDAVLALSPSDAHARDSPPYVEALDRVGALVPASTRGMYLRRWSITALDGDADTRLLIVCVTAQGTRASAAPAACVWSIRSRQP